MGYVDFAKSCSAADEAVVHKFDAGGIEAGFDHGGYQAGRLLHAVEHGQHIKTVGRQGLQLQRNFRDDAQSSLRAHDQLLQGITRGLLFQAGADIHDLAGGGDHFHAVDLVAGHAVTDGFDAAGVGGKVAADLAGLRAAGVPGIDQVVFLRGSLAGFYQSPRFRHHVQPFRVHFQNAVHPAHQQDDAPAHRDGPVRQAGAGTAHGNRDIGFIGQLYNGRHFLCRTGSHYRFRRMELGWICLFICFVLIQRVRICIHMFFSHNSLQPCKKFFINFVIHRFPPQNFSIL